MCLVYCVRILMRLVMLLVTGGGVVIRLVGLGWL